MDVRSESVVSKFDVWSGAAVSELICDFPGRVLSAAPPTGLACPTPAVGPPSPYSPVLAFGNARNGRVYGGPATATSAAGLLGGGGGANDTPRPAAVLEAPQQSPLVSCTRKAVPLPYPRRSYSIA